MTPKQLVAAGVALYGKNWQAPLAGDLNENEKLVALWAKGERLMSVPTQNRIALLLDKRLVAISIVRDQLN